ncbi:MAG: hypothetical protein GDA43_26115 [Hormoscilla sp. SP5CHS1]|nr:hypothetical protein [Hormoscilla sp. SP12CHS1]MBC6456204.1 hypothetical protein [Hormoscilla sp. SP5CHS1]
MAELRAADWREREANRREMAELRATVSSLVQIVEIHQRNFEEIVNEIRKITVEIREMQSEIRGLQVENRRILEHVFGPQDNDSTEQ